MNINQVSTVPEKGEPGLGPLKPPLKWAGGKRWLLPHLLPLWQPFRHQRLVEPFCGALAVALGLRPERALLNDINRHAVNFYLHLQTGLVPELPMLNDERFYYRCRERFNRLVGQGRDQSREAAELFYYLNRTGYNGLCRFNRRGEFNVPYGRYGKINYTSDFLRYRDATASWSFTAGDFSSVPLEDSDFVYADPPYDVQFTHYAKEGFSWEDQIRLTDWLSGHPGPVILSNQATTRIVALYLKYGFTLRFLEGPRLISCNGDRAPAREVLAFKNLTPDF
ncbi:MAG: Dam family site-specific DNA-(adenine-N6)-methyltransferase [Bacillota bacterium]